ncbi:Nitrous-oxide reductase [Bienertia sinuspersici]
MSSKTPNNNGRNPKNTIFVTPKWPSSRRNHSLSSSSSLSSNSSSSLRSFSNDDSPPPSPPQRIPFSWESIPGIPKQQIIKRLGSTPVSTTTTTTSTKLNYKKQNHIISRKDPFFAALVECSKGDEDDDDEENKVVFGNIWKTPAKSLSNRLGFVNFSCKNTCSVSESLVFLPREQPKRISYGLVKKNSR